MPVGIGEDRRPAEAVHEVNRKLFGDFQGVAGNRLGHEIVMIIMFDKENAAVE